MFTTSQVDPKTIKSKNQESIRDFHQSLLDNLGVQRVQLKPKTPFYDSRARKVIGVYESEFRHAANGGMYFEFADPQNNPTDPSRTVYRCPNNPAYSEEYEPSPSQPDSWLVPIEELRIVNPTSVAISGVSALVDLVSPQKERTVKPITKPINKKEELPDAPFSEMSVRDLYAVLHNKPVSNKEWLNNLINVTNK